MKRISIAAAVLVALTLTGCSGTTDEAQQGREPAVTEPVAASESTPEASAAPIAATPTPTDAPAAAATAEDEFVAAAQNYLNGWGYWDFTDEQLLGAGLYACESSNPAPQVIEGIDAAFNAEVVAQARTILCP